MAKLNLPEIGSLGNSASARQAINDNFALIEEAIDNTLSRDGTTPNQMEADLDMDGNNILNVADPVNDLDAVNLRSIGPLVEEFASEIAESIIEGTARTDVFTATASQTDFTLTNSPGTVNNMYVFDNGISMTPGVDFTLTGASNTILSFFGGRTDGSEIVCRYVQLSPADSLLRADLERHDTNYGADLVALKLPDTLARELSVGDMLEHGVNVLWYATPAQCAVDATSATQKAIDYAISSGRKVVYFPGGYTYKYLSTSASLNPGSGDIDFCGDGAHSTVLHFEEGTSTASIHSRKNLFQNVTTTEKGRVRFKGLHFKGTWAETGYTDLQGGAPIVLDYYKEIHISECLFTNLKSYCTVCEFIDVARVINNTFDSNARDLVRFRSSFNVLVDGNTFRHNYDDAVSLHSNSSLTGGDIREGMVVTNNVFEDTGGIKVLAGRMVNISGNILRRTKQYGIAVYSDSGSASEAPHSMFGVSITDNQIYDHLAIYPFSSPVSWVIGVYSSDAEGGSGTGSVIPGQPLPATGVFVKPWDWRNGKYSSTVDGVAPMYNVLVKNNIIARTLPAVATYSLWGYGNTWNVGGPQNPTVSEAALQPSVGILISGQARMAQVCGNSIGHTATPVVFDQPDDNFCMDNVRVTDNTLYDFATEALRIETPGSTKNCDLLFADNDIDGDPYHRSTNRKTSATTDGSWLADSFPQVLTCSSTQGVRLARNRIRNVCRILNGGTINSVAQVSNILRCDPTATGFSTSNKGIGNCPVAGLGFDYELYDSDPTSASYGTLLTALARDVSAMPATGKYVTGQFVYANGASGFLGWKRLTTGSAHVSGTDWQPINAP